MGSALSESPSWMSGPRVRGEALGDDVGPGRIRGVVDLIGAGCCLSDVARDEDPGVGGGHRPTGRRRVAFCWSASLFLRAVFGFFVLFLGLSRPALSALSARFVVVLHSNHVAPCPGTTLVDVVAVVDDGSDPAGDAVGLDHGSAHVADRVDHRS